MNSQNQPSPELFFDTLTAYQKTAALKAAIDLNVFTALADAPATALEVAKACDVAERGARILCDYLTVHKFLQKSGEKYSLTSTAPCF
jgi:DNA-binding IclR family transcriptional regulator